MRTIVNEKIFVLYMFITLNSCQNQDEADKNIENESNCRKRNRLITTDNGDIYQLVDAVPGQKLILLCHYCKENDDQQPKIWYKMEKLVNSSAHEVKLGMNKNTINNRLMVNIDHSLIFRNVTIEDSGFYYCIGLEGQESQNRYNYLVDVVFPNESAPETGNLTAWRKYHDENFLPITKQFAGSSHDEYVYLREDLHLKVELVTEWDPWGPCEICGRAKGEGLRRKKGFCRLKFSKIHTNNTDSFYTPKNDDEQFLTNVYAISCRSLLMGRLFPTISETTKHLPHFVQTENCKGTCNPDAEGLSKGWKSGKTRGFMYRKSYVLAQHAHLVLVCPESTLESKVEWRRNGKVLKAGERVSPSQPNSEPHIMVDTFNTLYLHDVTSDEEGNYTCQVDDIRMQQLFVRHMMYLAFVLSLTLTCYCAGLVIVCKRRHTFKGYEQLLEESQKQRRVWDSEDDEAQLII